VELVPDVEHRPEEVPTIHPTGGVAVLQLAAVILVDRLSIAAQRDPMVRSVDLGCRTGEAGAARHVKIACRRSYRHRDHRSDRYRDRASPHPLVQNRLLTAIETQSQQAITIGSV